MTENMKREDLDALQEAVLLRLQKLNDPQFSKSASQSFAAELLYRVVGCCIEFLMILIFSFRMDLTPAKCPTL